MTTALATLLNIIEDEFKSMSEVRVRIVSKSGTKRSYDLEQDYDPESSNIHNRSGVLVQTRTREYFFPEEWMGDSSLSEVNKQISVIRQDLGLYY